MRGVLCGNASIFTFHFAVNVADGGFFGLGLGFASYVTVIPLFVASLTDSSVIIGLIASLHTIGWQLPQLLTANRVAGMTRYKPLVMFMTLHERWPFFGLMVVALLIGTIPTWLALVLTLIFVSIQSLGGGFAATSWQSMIAKIIPSTLHGTFYGVQSAAANLLSSGGAVLAVSSCRRWLIPAALSSSSSSRGSPCSSRWRF